MEPAITSLLDPAALGILLTGLLLGIRHGIDWDHIAAITDITSTTAAAGMRRGGPRRTSTGRSSGDPHGHGGRARDAGPRRRTGRARRSRRRWRRARPSGRPGSCPDQVEAIRLGTLYALGHGAVVIALGLAALAFGALLPDWLDPIMGRIVGVTLVALGVWVMYSVYRYARAGERVPAAQPLDARLRRRSATAGAASRRGSTATSTSSRSR